MDDETRRTRGHPLEEKQNNAPPTTPPPRPLRRRVLRFCAAVLLLVAFGVPAYAWWTHRSPQPPTEIFRGVVYSCEKLPTSATAAGLMHWARIDLNEPGVELYVTPLDAEAVAQGWQYKLKYATAVAGENRLAVVINGTLFARSGWLPWPGAYAKGSETAVAAHEASHVDPHSFLLWFEEDRTPHMEKTRPPTKEALSRARWGISGNLLSLSDGEVGYWSSDKGLDRRTLIGVDPSRRLLWLVVLERATAKRAVEELKRLGATEGIALDGGSASELAIGPGAAGVRPGATMNTWAATANHIGVRADALPAKP